VIYQSWCRNIDLRVRIYKIWKNHLSGAGQVPDILDKQSSTVLCCFLKEFYFYQKQHCYNLLSVMVLSLHVTFLGNTLFKSDKREKVK
jgi:hypothetical protein